MTLPASGQISLQDVILEWDKGDPYSNVAMGTYAPVFGDSTPPYDMNIFYNKRVIKADASSWINPKGEVITGGEDDYQSSISVFGSFDISWRFLGHTASPNINTTMSYGPFSIDFDDGTGLNGFALDFQYMYSGIGWTLIKSLYAGSTGTHTFTAGTHVLGLTPAQSATLRYRIYWEWDSPPVGNETVDLGPSWSMTLSNLTGGTNDIKNIVLARNQWVLNLFSITEPTNTTYWNAGIT